MKLLLISAMLMLAATATAQEGVTRPIFNTANEASMLNMVPVCAPGTPVAVSGTKFVCGKPVTVPTVPVCAPGTPVAVSGQQFVCGKHLTPSKMNIDTVTVTHKQRGGEGITKAQCKQNFELLACSGGPGDQFENGEYWVLIPEYDNRRCVGYWRQPAYFGHYYSQIIVSAHCYKP
jgi:uncharacterized Zn-binding protein involved in type VI secretion